MTPHPDSIDGTCSSEDGHGFISIDYLNNGRYENLLI